MVNKGKYKGEKWGKPEVKVLVYGEDKKYVKDFVWEDVEVTKKGKKVVEKVKSYTGKYTKQKETDSTWHWVSLDKIEKVTAMWVDKYKDTFGYNRAKPSWGEGLTDEEKEALRKALNNEYDEKALARRSEGATTIEEHKKAVEKKIKEEKFEVPVKKEPGAKVKADRPTLNKKTLTKMIDSEDRDRIMALEQELRDEKTYTKDLTANKKELEAKVKELEAYKKTAEPIVVNYELLPARIKDLKRTELQELISFDHKYQKLRFSIKTYFEGEVLNYNKTLAKKDQKTIEDFAPEVLLAMMKNEYDD